MDMVVFILAWGVVFLAGVLVIAIVIEAKYADNSAAYRLYAVRDRLVSLVVFDGMSRNDPWFDGLYGAVNVLLQGARYFSGPKKWGLASATGKAIGEKCNRQGVSVLPDYAPPDEMKDVFKELEPALRIITSRHIGVTLLLSAEARARLKRQRAEARQLEKQIQRFELV